VAPHPCAGTTEALSPVNAWSKVPAPLDAYLRLGPARYGAEAARAAVVRPKEHSADLTCLSDGLAPDTARGALGRRADGQGHGKGPPVPRPSRGGYSSPARLHSGGATDAEVGSARVASPAQHGVGRGVLGGQVRRSTTVRAPWLLCPALPTEPLPLTVVLRACTVDWAVGARGQPTAAQAWPHSLMGHSLVSPLSFWKMRY
jgi:hypothetical protein